MSGPRVVLVDIHSATHSRPNDLGNDCIVPINRSHSDLVKFSKFDSCYSDTCRYLLKFQNTACDIITKRFGEEKSQYTGCGFDLLV